MKGSIKGYAIGMLCAFAAIFLWILLLAGLTGGREAADFTDTDKIIMTVFIIAEIITVIVLMSFAVLAGKKYGEKVRQSALTSQTGADKRARKQGGMLLMFAFLFSFVAMIGGVFLGNQLTTEQKDVFGWMMIISFLVALLMLVLSVSLHAIVGKWLDKRQIDWIQKFLYSHREHSEKTAAKKLRLLRNLRRITGVYAVILGVLGLCIAMGAGVIMEPGSSAGICIVTAILVMCPLARVRFPRSQDLFVEDKAYVPEEQYPYLYGLAKKAAKEIGCGGDIRIAVLPNCNAGIAKVGDCFSVQLGVILLCALSEEELYCVLLHEFSHMEVRNKRGLKERFYNAWRNDGKTPHFYSGLTELFFRFLDALYSLQFSLYDYADSIGAESAADQAMLLGSAPEVVASALIKLKYYELYTWEKGTYDEEPLYAPEKPGQPLTKDLQRFLDAMEQRSQDWNRLVEIEIQSRSASHPTTRLRLEALGIQKVQCVPSNSSTHYKDECAQALAYAEELLREDMAEEYAEVREAYYLKPKEQVEAWEAEGKPLSAEEYRDIVWALRQLGRDMEALELCQRAIAELPLSASRYAYLMRGMFRLHSYDPAGIPDIYTAVQNNNFLEEGIDALGQFCCLTGNQTELDTYREKAVAMAQKQKDEYSQTDVLQKKDKLSTEKLPEGMLEDILAYIASLDNGQIENIYLVRKTITPEYFTSVFIIDFYLDTPDEIRNELLHKISRHLDVCSEWQFSLFDFREVCEVPFYMVEGSRVYAKKEEE